MEKKGLKKRDLKEFRKRIDESYKEKLTDRFNCMICYEILEDPVKCIGCQKLVCSECISIWKTRKNSCPYCRKEFVELKLSDLEQDLLNETKFKCKTCEKMFTYEKRSCLCFVMKCSFGCGFETDSLKDL